MLTAEEHYAELVDCCEVDRESFDVPMLAIRRPEMLALIEARDAAVRLAALDEVKLLAEKANQEDGHPSVGNVWWSLEQVHAKYASKPGGGA